MNFFEALEIAIKKACEIKFRDDAWCEYHMIYSPALPADACCPALKHDDGFSWWPDFEEQREKSWSVKPEEEKPKDIFVWGACDNDGIFGMYSKKPIKREGSWRGQEFYGDLFPKDKPKNKACAGR